MKKFTYTLLSFLLLCSSLYAYQDITKSATNVKVIAVVRDSTDMTPETSVAAGSVEFEYLSPGRTAMQGITETGNWTEVEEGIYLVTLAAAQTDTVGTIFYKVTGTGFWPYRDYYEVWEAHPDSVYKKEGNLDYLDASISSRGTADPGDAMTLTTGERTAVKDTVYTYKDDFKADVSNLDATVSSRGTADPGDAMTLTTGERTAVKDTIYTYKDDFKADVSNLDATVSSRGTADPGDAMTLTTGERTAVKDTIYTYRDDFKATGYAVSGDPMTLTTGERAAIKDTVYTYRNDFKADVSNLDATVSSRGTADPGDAMSLTTAERSALNDTIYAYRDDYKATGFAVAGDSVKIEAVDKTILASWTADSVECATCPSAAEIADEVSDTLIIVYSFARDATKADYKATGFAVQGDSMTITGADKQSFSDVITADLVSTDNIARNATANSYKADVSGLSTFDPATDDVTVDSLTANAITDLLDSLDVNLATPAEIADEVEDTLRVNLDVARDATKADYKATGFAVAGDSMRIKHEDKLIIADVVEDSIAAGTFTEGDSVRIMHEDKLILADVVEDSMTASTFSEGDSVRIMHEDKLILADVIEDSISCTSTGEGATQFTLVAIDTSGSDVPVGDVHCWVSTDSAGTNIVAGTINTESDGEVRFMLDTGVEYWSWWSKDMYNFPVNPDSIDSNPDTVYCFDYTPQAPGSDSLVKVYDTIYDWNGARAASAILTFTPTLKYGKKASPYRLDRTLSSVAVRDTTNSNGYFEITLMPNDIISPTGTKYELVITFSDGTTATNVFDFDYSASPVKLRDCFDH